MRVIKYTIGILLIISGVKIIIDESIFTGILSILLGGMILPPISEKMKRSVSFWQNKVFRYTLYTILLLVTAGAINKNKKQSKIEKTGTKIETDSVFKKVSTSVENETCNFGGEDFYIIPDIVAADIYPNFENKGFKITKQINSDNTSIICELNSQNIKFDVLITGCTPDKIIAIEATAMDYSGSNQKEVENFLSYVATLQYKDSDPERARKWVIKNINSNNAKITIGALTFSINFKTIHSKLLRMEIKP